MHVVNAPLEYNNMPSQKHMRPHNMRISDRRRARSRDSDTRERSAGDMRKIFLLAATEAGNDKLNDDDGQIF